MDVLQLFFCTLPSSFNWPAFIYIFLNCDHFALLCKSMVFVGLFFFGRPEAPERPLGKLGEESCLLCGWKSTVFVGFFWPARCSPVPTEWLLLIVGLFVSHYAGLHLLWNACLAWLAATVGRHLGDVANALLERVLFGLELGNEGEVGGCPVDLPGRLYPLTSEPIGHWFVTIMQIQWRKASAEWRVRANLANCVFVRVIRVTCSVVGVQRQQHSITICSSTGRRRGVSSRRRPGCLQLKG